MNRVIVRLAALAVLSVFFLRSVAFAQDTQAVLTQAQEKCAQFEAQVTDMHMVQTMATHTIEGDVSAQQTVYTKGKMSRIEMEMQLPESDGISVGDDVGSLKTVMIDNGEQAWMFSPFGGKKELSREEAERNAPARNCWGFFPENAKITGSETMQGRDCYIVEIEEPGAMTRLWLDKQNFIPVQGETRDSAGVELYRWIHSDFHRIHGDWEYPYRTEMYEGSELAATMLVTSLDVNQGVSDDLFDPDKVSIPQVDIQDLLQMMAVPEDTGGMK